MRVYVVRHGESETNRSKRWTGWLDVSLTEKGEEDARKAGAVLAGTVFDKVYSSDLRRAKRTAEIALPGCGYETSPLLREINVGNLENQPIEAVTFHGREQAAKRGYDDVGGESRTEFNGRISRFMELLESAEEETVAVFSHGGWLRGMLDMVLGMHIPREKICCDNCMIAVFEYKKENWQLHSWINLS